ncbi:hypothetical protein JTB14_003021 [Gonioctena quinquepunctata]|nr:hypothetical protein JTB14_003021 [Gonioctena quinquepunctata]
MSFSAQEFMLARQKCRQWVPLITQQFRLRHVYQIIGFNLCPETAGSFYFTLHLTTMCAPFYTSEHLKNPHPKWEELNLKDMPNGSASCVVLRIWQHDDNGADKIVLTWGVHFSGLCYIGHKIADIQPKYFKNQSVIFYMQGGFYTSHLAVKTGLRKPIPFIKNLNLIDTLRSKVIYKRIAINAGRHEIQNSYNIEKLRRLQYLQIQIRKKGADVQNIRDKINVLNSYNVGSERENPALETVSSSSLSSVRYAPQLLTMNSLNKMLKEKPTTLQKQKMAKISRDIEVAKFKARLLSQEKDKKSVMIRASKQKYLEIMEENGERESDLMENYRILSKGSEKLKEYKKNILQHREMYSNIHVQLQQRRCQLLKQLSGIYPIDKTPDDKFSILGIHLPNSDVLADCSDTGLSVALGYIAHILIMISTFLQVPLRYPVTNYGSRSYITDNISSLLPDKDKDFPLFTRGKDKVQFTYAVYLLNKNLAQFRWLLGMNTADLRATLRNLLTFLQGPIDLSLRTALGAPPDQLPSNDSSTLVSLQRFGSISNISDPILDCIKNENRIKRSSSPPRKSPKKSSSLRCRSSECGKGLSEILAIPEAYLNKQISSDSFRNYMRTDRHLVEHDGGEDCCGRITPPATANNSFTNLIKITAGTEENSCDTANESPGITNIEQGTEALDSPTKLSTIISKTIKIYSDGQLQQKSVDVKQNRRISRSVGSYTDEEGGFTLRASFELGSDPLVNVTSDITPPSTEECQQELLEKWLANTPSLLCSREDLYPDDFSGVSTMEMPTENPLMARTDALLTTKSFNLIKPKQ